MYKEFAKLIPQDVMTARATGHALVNAIEEYAQVMEELVAELTKKHAKQTKALSKGMLQLTTAINLDLNAAPTASAMTPATNTGKTAAQLTKVQDRKVQKCNHLSPLLQGPFKLSTHNQCWHLEKNAAEHPARWTASGAKSTST